MDRIKNLILKLIDNIKIRLILDKKKSFSLRDGCVDRQQKNNGYIIDLKFYEKINIRYIKNPEIFYIENHIEDLFKSIKEVLDDSKYIIKIGIESEFYALNVTNKIRFYSFIKDFSGNKQIDLSIIKPEEGQNQFELEFSPYSDIDKLILDFNTIKQFLLKSEYNVIFVAKPFYYDVGSALQINITINDKNGNNLFAKNNNNESTLLKKAVAGLLEKTNELLPLYIKSKDCLLRYDLEFNKIYFLMGKIPAPTYNSWGINNRTCSIRIPTPKNYNSKEEYKTEDKNNRRIEFRIPSSDCNLKLTIFGVLYSIIYGIENQLEPPEPTSNNVFSQEFLYKPILKNID